MDYLKESAIGAIPFANASMGTRTDTIKSNNPPDHHDHIAVSSSTATHYSPPPKNNNINYPKRKKMTLSEWIAGAINDGDNPNNGKGSEATALLSSSLSSEYLKCALKIAHSLADQLCQVQVVAGQEVVAEKQGEKGDISWSNLVAIYVSAGAAVANALNGDEGDDGSVTVAAGGSSSSKEGEEEEKKDNTEKLSNDSDGAHSIIEPDPDILGQPPTSKPEELQAMLNSIIPDHSLYLEDDDEWGEDLHNADNNNGNSSSSVPCHDDDDVSMDRKKAGGLRPEKSRKNKSGSHTDHQTAIQYLNISSAKLEIENDESWHHHKQGDERMHIYLLGRVFFELFSGGRNGDTNTNEHAQLQGDSYSFNALNLVTATNILDALGEDDEIFGSGDVFGDVTSQQTKRQRSITVEDLPLQLEQLRSSLGLPISLCDLIVNMIHCSEGDFSKDETYSTMADVKKDLKHMLEYPDIYLCDLNLKDACASGLHIDDNGMFGRDAEFASLKELYLSSSVPNGCVCAIVSGTGGVGKTTLLNELINYAKSSSRDGRERKDCVILTGKFDKVSQSQPYSAVSSAFNEYCDWLSRAENACASEKVSLALKQDLSPVYVRTIAKLVPSLFKIIGDYVDGQDDTDGFDGAEKRLRFLLCRFLHIIRQALDSTLILCLDDLQWADKSSIALINQVIMAFNSSDDDHGFFFLGGCRETESDHALWKMISFAADSGIHTTKIELGGIDQEAANLLVSTKLKLLPRLTLPLAAILHHRCKGNPMFMEQFMVELCHEGLLRPSLALRRWVWDEEKIFERQLPDDLVEFITKSLDRLPKEVISSLCILSCFGTSTDCSLVEKLQNAAGLSLSDPLDIAVAQGMLNKKNKIYSFVHDRVQEAVYNVMKPEERWQYHYKYGMSLCTVAMKDNDDGLLLIAVGQINLSGSMALDDEDAERGVKAAKLNLSAGKIARGMSDLFSAYSFFDHGISALRKGHWENHYQLSLELYNGAAFCALANGDKHATLEILTDQILHYARCYADKMHAMFIILISLHHKGKVLSAIEHAFDVLSQLGEVFPREFTPDVVSQSYENTKAMLRHLSDKDLLNYKRVHDPMKEMAIKFLTKLSQTMCLCRPSDQPVIIMRIIEISLVHGFSPQSHVGFALYGSFIARTGDIRGGYRFAKLSKALFNKTGAAQSSAEGLAYTTQTIAHIEPIQSVIDLNTNDCKVIMAEGCEYGILLNSFLRCYLYFWGGEKLSRVLEFFEENRRMVIQHKNMSFLAMLMPARRTVLTLHGTSVEPLLNSANDLNVDSNKVGNKTDKSNLLQSNSFRFHQMLIAFMFRRYDDTKSLAIKYSEFKIGFWMMFFHQTLNSFYDGLVSYWIGREENNPKWIRKGANCKLEIQKLAESSPWNFQNKLYLLSAEEQFCERNFEFAERYYDIAVSSAKDHKFLNEEALANEMAGYFYLETGRRKKSIRYFSEAIKCYEQWEAHVKVKSLEKYLEEVIDMASS